MRVILPLLILWTAMIGCSHPNPDVKTRRLPDGRIQVDGPLAGPFANLTELAASACERITSQPGATNGVYGIEYCALHYYSPEDNGFYLSYLSDIGGNLANGGKYCEVPTSLRDLTHKDVILLGGDHSHPHNRKFSRQDLSIRSHWHPTRFMDRKTNQLWDRQLMVFSRSAQGECLAYIYNNATRVVSALRGRQWVPIGMVYNDEGDVRMLDGQDW